MSESRTLCPIMLVRLKAEQYKKIIKSIFIRYYPRPLSLHEIIDEMKPDLGRSQTISYLKELQKSGKVGQEKDKKKGGKYYITQFDANIAAFRLGYTTLGILGNRTLDEKMGSHIFSFVSKLKPTDLKEEDKLMNLKLFMLSHNIGTLIISYILSGLDPNNEYINKTLAKYSAAKRKPKRKTERKLILDRSQETRNWVKDCINVNILLLKTIDYIRTIKDRKQIDDWIKFGKKVPTYYLSKDTLMSAAKSYFNLYPDISSEIRIILKDLASG